MWLRESLRCHDVNFADHAKKGQTLGFVYHARDKPQTPKSDPFSQPPCREAVRRVQAWRVASKRSVPDESTSGYCQARARLPLESLRAAHEQIGEWICRHTQEAWRWCDRSVKVLDGCGISMPDTEENRARWPYAGGQKPGCGFPTAQMVGLFCLATGRLVRFALDSWKAHEIPLAPSFSWVGAKR